MSVPKEISKFLNRSGVVLLIRGEPGTGKTKMSLELMKNYNMAYVGTKRTVEEIKREYPWITEEMKEHMFAIDEKYDYRETDRFGSVFYLIPEALRKVLNLVEDGKINGIIIDSWHGIINELNILAMEEKEREKIYDSSSFFLKLIRLSDMDVNFIVVREGNEDDNLSYLADGVVTAWKNVKEGRLYRWFTIDKLRGVEIEKNVYFFTLKENKFNYLHSSRFKHPQKILGYKPSSEIPGSTYFDDIFTVRRSHTVVFDFGEHVPVPYKVASLMGFIASFSYHGSRVIIIPPNGFDMSDLKYSIYIYKLERYYKNITYLYGEGDVEEFARLVDFSNSKEIVKVIHDEIHKNVSEFAPLIVVGYDRLNSYMSSHDTMKTMYRLKDTVKELGGVTLIAGNIMGEENKKFSSSISDIYVKFKNINGDVVMYGIKPWTRVHHLDIKYEEYPKLIPKVIV